MKRLVMLICGVWISLSTFAQVPGGKFVLPLATDKTTSLIFPFAIRYVDRGTKDVLAQQVSDAENLLLVKAASENFKATNLSVVTADGQVYSFEVIYIANPQQTVFNLTIPPLSFSKEIVFAGDLMNAKEMEDYSKGILDNPKFIRGIKDIKWDMMAKVIGIYIKGNLIFYHMALINLSPIDFDIDFIRFYIRDKRKGKRTATQEIELPVHYKIGNSQKVNSNNENLLAFALEKFTVPDAKYFFIEIGEKNGGRHLRLRVNNNKLLKAKTLPAYK